MIREEISLAGAWMFRIDSLDKGIEQGWFNELSEENVILPGSMAGNNKGNEVGINTPWTGDIVDRSYFVEKRYEKYRKEDNIKIPFWLKPVKYYKGAAWYQKEVDIPAGWKDKRIVLFLERCHWESTLFVNGTKAGTLNSLSVPHEYDISGLVREGKNLISIRIDNRIIVPVGVNSHSISDHTQGNWNGIAGEIKLTAGSRVYIDEIRVHPHPDDKAADVTVRIVNREKAEFNGKLIIGVSGPAGRKERTMPQKKVTFVTDSGEHRIEIKYRIYDQELWSEFSPALYRLSARITGKEGIIDTCGTDFGMREFRANGTRFEINGDPVFLRGTTECCIFPLTGYPPTDYGSWEKVLGTIRDHGMNHVRFHSYCPPGAAFKAADRLGIYFHVECGSWANQGTSIGDGGTLDRFIYEEGDRIIKKYGNHPSFCMLAYGNEPAGSRQKEFLGELINHWRATDNRRVYTSAAGWPVIPENDFHLIPDPRIQQWGAGLGSIINSQPPNTEFDFSEVISRYPVPVVGHEIGQWCVYPDFSEISRYTGPLKPTNLEIFRETLNENGMGDQAEDFLKASGKLQSLCYKADIEAAFRTPGFAGFQMLQLHDFPGQGTALVGILNPFFESKGYITPEEFRMFCNSTVPLAVMEKMIISTEEDFRAGIKVAHYGGEPLTAATVMCRIIREDGESVHEQAFTEERIETGTLTSIGDVRFDPSGILKPQKFTLEVSVRNTPYRNQWDFWVYPSGQEIENGRVYVTDKLDGQSRAVLRRGGAVLLLTYGSIKKEMGADVATGFSTVFWNTAWTNNQPPHTLGILCDPAHPVFRIFPTEYHSNWQWWDPVTHSQAMIINDFPSGIRPLIQLIDTWFENRKLALAFEVNSGGGKLLVCSIDLNNLGDDRLVSKQLLRSILDYMNSDRFNPLTEVSTELISKLLATTAD